MPEVEPISSELTMPQYGSYRVLHPLGSGGMSSVYRALHVETGHEVALKVLPVHLAKNPIVLQRFMREARSAESLEHPSIVSIFDRGVDRGRHYLVLEYVDGIDLHGYVQTKGPLGVAEATRVIHRVAEALEYAVRRGVVHRDIKPSNILRSSTGEIKVTDLGLALQWEFEDERVTREGTTVGTVDYMAPEQARDSRAAGPLSDLYSLGCTFYYLLTGIPPFPGGDITDKLTRHAQAPPPDVRDLRPDVPESVSRIMTRMMAKRPDDRFASFDDLIRALDSLDLEDDTGVAVALIPLEGQSPAAEQASRAVDESRPPSSIPEISLASLPPELVMPVPAGPAARPDPMVAPMGGANGTGALLPRSLGPDRRASLPPDEVHRTSMSAAGWVSLCTALGACFVISVVIIDRFVRYSPSGEAMVSRGPELEGRSDPESAEPTPAVPSIPRPPRNVQPTRAKPEQPTISSRAHSTPEWTEPSDVLPPPRPEPEYTEETLRKYLPAWALTPVPRSVEGPRIVVRRVPGPGEASLRAALDETKGTVEIADEGPFVVNDLRAFGESRVIRARDGFRTIVHVDRSPSQVVRSLPGVMVLEGKSLVLDSLDLIINLRDLSPSQTCLFYCNGANLTVRNCTITLINPGSLPFALVRTGPADARGCRIRFENTLVRGAMSLAADLGPGPADLVLRDSLLAGCQGPLIRSEAAGQVSEHRVAVMGSITVCQGPAVDLPDREGGAAAKPRPLTVRAFHSVFGRFQGAGIASVIASGSPSSAPRERVDWDGDRNLYCGWKGFFAAGKEATLVVSGLSSLRSTWNGSDGQSQEIPVSWPRPQYLGQVEARHWLPFVPGWEAILARVAEARPFLAAKTVWSFPEVQVPVPLVLTQAVRSSADSPLPEMHQVKEHLLRKEPRRLIGDNRPSQAPASNGTNSELLFDAEAAEWHGDLGAFLREKILPSVRRARIRVRGSGPRRASPVRLPDGLVLEIRVEPPPGPATEWLSWSPEPESSARALIELHGGSMVLSNLRLRDDPSASVQSLLHVEHGDLILHRCQLTGTTGQETRDRWLVTFASPSTQPRPQPPSGIFTTPPERPVCVIGESTLIAQGGAIRAEIGSGLVALFQTALAASGDAIELVPAAVARARFAADLVLNHCTLASETNIVRLRAWQGTDPGPDRPWIIQTEYCAYLGSYDRRVSDTVLLRADRDAMARGLAFWQAIGDAVEVDRFVAMQDEPPSGRSRDVVVQWVNLWGGNHQREITGPRAGSNLRSVRLFEPLKAGRVEPQDLILDPDHHPRRSPQDVGADLSRQDVLPRSGPGGRRH
jgi:serine/threonine-protein kinase